MNLLERLNQFVVGRMAFPATNYFLNRRNILGRYRKLLLSERYSKEALRELQFERLRALLRHANQWSPFYTKRFKDIGLVPEDLKSLEDIRRIPPLVRKEVIQGRFEMVDVRYRQSIASADQASDARHLEVSSARLRKYGLVRDTSSGSTGTPTTFYDDGSTAALSWVHELRLKKWYGLGPGVKEARMSAISTEYVADRKFPPAREWLWNQMILPGYLLSDRDYELSLRKIRQFRPRVLWGPTHALVGLAHYVQRLDEDISQCRPDLVISRAAPLFEYERRFLTTVFGCPATNIYGTREVGHVAMTCPHGNLHVNQENYLVEIEGAGINQENTGPGKILITPLFESPMPFIRYQIGDLAEMGGSDCPCGRSLIALKKILGRAGDVFRTKDGQLIYPNFWCLAFEEGTVSQDVEGFQVVYQREDRICIRIVPKRSYSAETEATLRHFMERILPYSIHFEFEYVPEIKPQPSGKHLFIVNEIEKPQEKPVLVEKE